jgi:hypothetical protein
MAAPRCAKEQLGLFMSGLGDRRFDGTTKA